MRAPGLDRYRLTVPEVSHMQLASGRSSERTVRDSVYYHSARSTDPLTAIVIEGDRVLGTLDQAFVHDIEHLQKRHVRRDVVGLVLDKVPLCCRVLLSPYTQ